MDIKAPPTCKILFKYSHLISSQVEELPHEVVWQWYFLEVLVPRHLSHALHFTTAYLHNFATTRREAKRQSRHAGQEPTVQMDDQQTESHDDFYPLNHRVGFLLLLLHGSG